MSGVNNLANAVANEPGFASKAGMTSAEAAKFVQPGKLSSKDCGPKGQCGKGGK